jgi:hypothetical protein
MFGGVGRREDRKKSNSKKANTSSTTSVVLDSNGVPIDFSRKSIEELAQGFTSLLYALGETNDEDETADDIAEDIFLAFQDAKIKQKRKSQNK